MVGLDFVLNIVWCVFYVDYVFVRGVRILCKFGWCLWWVYVVGFGWCVCNSVERVGGYWLLVERGDDLGFRDCVGYSGLIILFDILWWCWFVCFGFCCWVFLWINLVFWIEYFIWCGVLVFCFLYVIGCWMVLRVFVGLVNYKVYGEFVCLLMFKKFGYCGSLYSDYD